MGCGVGCEETWGLGGEHSTRRLDQDDRTMTWVWGHGVLGFLWGLGCGLDSLPSAGLFLGDSLDTLCLALLGHEVSYLVCAYFWGDEVVGIGRYLGAHAAHTHTHTHRGEKYIPALSPIPQPSFENLRADVGPRSTISKCSNNGTGEGGGEENSIPPRGSPKVDLRDHLWGSLIEHSLCFRMEHCVAQT